MTSLAELLACGQLVPVDPRASYYARGSDPMQYSGAEVSVPARLVASLDDAVSDSDCVPLLGLRGAIGSPRTWHVHVWTAPGAPRIGPGTMVRIRWSIGALYDVADVDVRSGSATYAVTAEGMDVSGSCRYLADYAPPNPPGPLSMRVAVSPFPLPGDYRAPTLTRAVVSLGGNVALDVPRHATQVTVYGPAGALWDWRSDGALSLGQWVQSGGAIDVPAGARALAQFSGAPGVYTAVWRLAL